MAPALQWLPQGAKALPVGAREGLNDWRHVGYGGPCPPTGKHRCFFKLYALGTWLPGLTQPTKAQVERAMQGHMDGTAPGDGTCAGRR